MTNGLSQGIVLAMATVLAALICYALLQVGRGLLDGAQVITRRRNGRDRVATLSISRSKALGGTACYAACAGVVAGWMMFLDRVILS